MNFIVLWLATSAVSFLLEIINESRMFKGAADAGYMIDVRRLSESADQICPNGAKTLLLSMLIPVLNIMLVFQRIVYYNDLSPILFAQLNTIGVLEEMTEIEKQEYLRKPTKLNALLMLLKKEIRVAKAKSIKISIDNEKSETFHKTNESVDDNTILKIECDASRLTKDEKKVVDALSNNDNLDLSRSLEDKNAKFAIHIQKLEGLKNEQYVIHKTPSKSRSTLTKRKKLIKF